MNLYGIFMFFRKTPHSPRLRKPHTIRALILAWGLVWPGLADGGQHEPYQWKNVEIIGGGFITGIIAHPAERGLMYVRTDVGGAYRWNPEAERWKPITDWISQADWQYTGIESLGLDPSDPDRLYMAAGIYNNENFPKGTIFFSEDRGETWLRSNLELGMGGNEAGRGSGERLAVDPSDGRIVYFGSRSDGLWRSADHGKHWKQVSSFPAIKTGLPNPTPGQWNYLTQDVGIVWLEFIRGNEPAGTPTQKIIAAVSRHEDPLWMSEDAGKTWQVMEGQPQGLRPINSALASNGNLYITYGQNPGPNDMVDGAVHRYNTHTGAWKNISPETPDPANGKPGGFGGIDVDAQHPDTLVVATANRFHSGGDEVFRSTDAGKTWKAIGHSGQRDPSLAPWLAEKNGYVHTGHWMYALAIDPFDSDKAYYGTGATIWGSLNLTATDRGQTSRWAVAARGIEETVPLDLLAPPGRVQLITGTGDISGFTVTDPDVGRNNVQMTTPKFSNTYSLDASHLKPNLVVRVGRGGWNPDVDQEPGAYSKDGGFTWEPFKSFPEVDMGHSTITVSSDSKTWVWADMKSRAFASRDHGRSWEPLDDSVAIVISDRADPDLFYATPPSDQGSAGLLVSSDTAHTFSPADPNGPTNLSELTPVPGHRGHLWMISEGAIWFTPDAGKTFASRNSLNDVTHLAVGKAAPGEDYPTLFAAGRRSAEQGFFRSTDRGSTWVRINDDTQQFGQVRVLSGDPDVYGRLYLGTGGRGVFYGDPQADSEPQ